MTISTAEVPTLEVAALAERLRRGERPTILDVRPAAERAEWAIPGSLHYDAYARLKADDPAALDGLTLPTDAPVVTVCAAGRMSLKAAALLRQRGIDAVSLAGGMQSWSLAWNTADVELTGSPARVVQVRRAGKGCLSYVVGCGDQALVLDPALDPDVYLDLAHERGWTIAQVLDTHVHADHLSRARALAERAGATLRLPEQRRVTYPFNPLRDGDVLLFCEARVAAVATPGHTGESMSFLLDGRALFTGDTLFLASVGRPDLEASADEARERARLVFRSLQRLFTLPPETVILPGHTSEPIAFDGRALGATLGEVRERIQLPLDDEAAFVDAILARIPPTPPNHQRIVELNEAGLLPAGDLTELEAGANRCAVS
jgi:glyoxylase-like metal-dependent hydrolase (beta-lactamase superfamily II)/rhodanese-related sulfurtransferase